MFPEVENLEMFLEEEILDIDKELSDLENEIGSIKFHIHDSGLAVIRNGMVERKTFLTGLKIYINSLNQKAEEYKKQHPNEENPYDVSKKELFNSMKRVYKIKEEVYS